MYTSTNIKYCFVQSFVDSKLSVTTDFPPLARSSP